MATFASLMSSLGAQPGTPAKTPTSNATSIANGATPAKNPVPKTDANGVRETKVAGVKRKSEDMLPAPASKSMKLENGTQTKDNPPAEPYRGTSKPSSHAAPRPNVSQNTKGQMPSALNKTAPSAAAATATTKPLRGFAATLAKAQAAATATQASGPAIKHKPVEKLSKRERDRLRQEQAAQQKAKDGSKHKAGRARDDVAKGSSTVTKEKKKISQLEYQGTMKKATKPLSYKGTMNSGTSSSVAKSAIKGSRNGQLRRDYDDYDDEDDDDGERYGEDEEDSERYDSEGSSDMEGGFDDMEREESNALRLAQQEDREALLEEEQHKREKMERKRKLLELSKAAAAKRRY